MFRSGLDVVSRNVNIIMLITVFGRLFSLFGLFRFYAVRIRQRYIWFFQLLRGISDLSSQRSLPPPLLPLLACLPQNPCNNLHTPQTIIIRRNGVSHPSRIRIGIDDPHRRDPVQPALMQQDVVLQRVQTHHQIRLHNRPIEQLPLIPRDLLVQRIDHLHPAPPEDLVAVGDRPGRPALEQVAPAGQPRGVDDAPVLPLPRAGEEDHAGALGDAADDAACAAEVGGGDVEGDDVDAGADAEDVAGVSRVPEGGGVAEVRLGGEEELERNVGGGRRVGEEGGRLVGGGDACAEVGG